MTVSSRCVLDERPTAARTVGLTRKHVLMLALAIEVLAFGASRADRYQRPAVVVDQPATIGHAIV
ncbi:hypothetical protein [Methylobacterium brachythecii]|uniref:Uncharacterized protein n=1 Tax=Methylobacterium brachythecii TaxID=1176177 RepID=A0A7W6F6T7_9HYPH|nr:hypothetical protein [Methylobacterium brachythecii]MBB3902689.1 hypothetical protein [Methylobacterium brachythecii]GLS42534.1 hypothetical protein GCM10007884_05190 [Methylobacterium brachythecii]